ncbi:MAG: FAD:protein FMN transferase, partial [Clostridia bacterium]|nr:FAD:protein FMN transferase [Clostridia bacterium]
NGGAQLDLGGIAKGYLSGRMIDIFKESGVKSAIISLGGNVQCLGTKPDGTPWKIAIQHPCGDGFIGTLSASDTAVITSGGYQRFFERDGTVYHHIIDPKTGTSAHSGLKSVTIITPDSTRADGLSTAVYVMGLEKAAELWRGGKDFDMVLMTDDDKVYVTDGIAKDFKSEFEVKVIY